MRTILLLPLLLGGLGCEGASPEQLAREVCGQGTRAVDEAVYSALTATSWFDRGNCEARDPLPPTCNRVELAGDGTYSWTAFSDAPERDESGAWNFRARDATGGVICLDNGSVIDFELTPTGGLRWEPLGVLDPEAPLGRAPGRGALPTIAVDPFYIELTDHAWAKTDELDLYRLPTTLTLRGNGTFTAELRQGECVADGTFSLVRERNFRSSRLTFWANAAPNRCDLRDGGTPYTISSGDTPRIDEDGVLHLTGTAYRDARISTERRLIAFSSYSEDAGLTVTAEWDGALRAGTATSWAISLHNNGGSPQMVSSLRIDLTPLALTGDGFTAAGPVAIAVDRALGFTIAPGDTLPLAGDTVFTPGPAGWTLLHIEVDSSDSRQPYRNQDSYIVELP